MAKLTLTRQLEIAAERIAELETQLAALQKPAAPAASGDATYPRFVEAYSDSRLAMNAAVGRNKAGLHCKVMGRSLFALDARTYERLTA